jgi:hypothetical protein
LSAHAGVTTLTFAFYKDERPHQALDYRTPRAVFEKTASDHVNNAWRL